jgi:hypothetical protein
MPENRVLKNILQPEKDEVCNLWHYITRIEPGSSDSIVSYNGLNDRGSITDRGQGENLSPSFCFQTGSGGHPGSSTMGTGVFHPGQSAFGA